MRSISLAIGALDRAVRLRRRRRSRQGTPTNVRGKVDKLDGKTLTVKSRDGHDVTVALADNFGVARHQEGEPRRHQAGRLRRRRRIPGKDGKLHAQEVLIFPEAARGTGEGHYAWDLRGKNDSMTNATVAQVASVAKGETHRPAVEAQGRRRTGLVARRRRWSPSRRTA